MHDIKKIVDSTQKCQRNWDLSKDISQEDIDTLIYTATHMPSKNNRILFDMFYTTDRDLIDSIYKISYSADDVEHDEGSNSQMNANLLFMWFSNGADYGLHWREQERDQCTDVGISAGAVALTANQMGYKTGFCQCQSPDKLNKIINVVNKEKIGAILGIGYPMKDVPHYHSYYNGQFQSVRQSWSTTHPKQVKVRRL